MIILGRIVSPKRKADPQADLLREARLAAARRNSHWQEIEDDLVPRGYRDSLLVSAETDAVYTRHTGVVFPPHQATPLAAMASLFWYLDADGELQFLERHHETWSQMVARMGRIP